MPGIILVNEDPRVTNGVIEWKLLAEKINLLADTITVTYYPEEQSGASLPELSSFMGHESFLLKAIRAYLRR